MNSLPDIPLNSVLDILSANGNRMSDVNPIRYAAITRGGALLHRIKIEEKEMPIMAMNAQMYELRRISRSVVIEQSP